MRHRLSRRTMMSGAAATVAPGAVHGAAPVRLVRLAQNNAAAAVAGLGCRAFAAAASVHPLLHNNIRVQVYDDSAAGDEMVAVHGVLNGTVDATLTSTGPVSSIVPEFGLLDTPFLFASANLAHAALDGAIGAEMADIGRTKGINVLAWGENGLRHMTANKPIRRPGDLAGLKMRVPQSDVEVTSFRALGAMPSPLPFTALYEALRTGEFEAEENPIAIIEVGRLYEVQKYLSLTRHIYSAYVFLASQDLLDDLSPAQQAALADCARQGAAATRMAAGAAERDGVARLQEAGMTVITDIDFAAFLAASKPNLAALGQKYGADLMSRLIQAGA